MKGIDVSLYQGVIDWSRVRASGVRFAMIKSSQANFVDPQFVSNITNAHRAGLACGVYHYLDATTVGAAVTEAKWFVQTLTPYKDCIDLWASLDVENPEHRELSKAQLTDIAIAFCEEVKRGGFKPMIYGNRDFFVNHYDMSRLTDYPLWYACWYNAEGEWDNPQHGFEYKIWQHGVVYVDGINGQVDGDFGYFELPEGDEIEVGDIVHLRAGAKYYGLDVEIPDFVLEKDWIVDSVSGNRVVINEATDGTSGINSAVYAEDCTILGNTDNQMDEPPAETEPQEPQKPDVEAPPVDDGEPTTNPVPPTDDPPQSTEDPQVDPPQDDNEDDDDSSTLVDFFKMLLRACLIAIRSLFGKGGNK